MWQEHPELRLWLLSPSAVLFLAFFSLFICDMHKNSSFRLRCYFHRGLLFADSLSGTADK